MAGGAMATRAAPRRHCRDLGQTVMLTPAGNRYGLPAFYALHSWIWKPNPSGLFQPYNRGSSVPNGNLGAAISAAAQWFL